MLRAVRDVLLRFVQTLRRHGIEVSLAETMDALAAVAAAGVERAVLREALAATLVKDERDRAAFDLLFEASFPALGAAAETGRGRRRGGGAAPGAGEPGGAGAGGAGAGGTGAARGAATGAAARAERPAGEREAPPRGPGRPAGLPPGEERAVRRSEGLPAGERPPDARPGLEARQPAGGRRARRAALLAMPFVQMTARDVAEARELVAALGARLRGRLVRRERLARRGRVDLRRTLRAASGTGGVPLRLRRRARRPGRPDLVALCDLSGSVAAASELLLGLLAPAHGWFRRVDTFAFVDRLCPVSIEQGNVAPEGPLDLYARSDFGRVLADLWPAYASRLGPRTLLLVAGDARNNRLPPRRDLWREIRARAGRIVWLVPEPRARWDTGDSVLRLYAPACDAVVECLELASLVAAVRRAL